MSSWKILKEEFENINSKRENAIKPSTLKQYYTKTKTIFNKLVQHKAEYNKDFLLNNAETILEFVGSYKKDEDNGANKQGSIFLDALKFLLNEDEFTPYREYYIKLSKANREISNTFIKYIPDTKSVTPEKERLIVEAYRKPLPIDSHHYWYKYLLVHLYLSLPFRSFEMSQIRFDDNGKHNFIDFENKQIVRRNIKSSRMWKDSVLLVDDIPQELFEVLDEFGEMNDYEGFMFKGSKEDTSMSQGAFSNMIRNTFNSPLGRNELLTTMSFRRYFSQKHFDFVAHEAHRKVCKTLDHSSDVDKKHYVRILP